MRSLLLLATVITLVVIVALIIATVAKWLCTAVQETEVRAKKKQRKLAQCAIQNPQAAKAKAASLGLPGVFVRIWDGQPPTRFCWDRADSFFKRQEELVGRYRRLKSALPLFEDDHYLYGLDLTSGEYFRCDIYEGKHFEVLASHYQGFAASLLVEAVYAGSEDLPLQASVLEFKHLNGLLKWADVEIDSSDADDAKREFVASIPT